MNNNIFKILIFITSLIIILIITSIIKKNNYTKELNQNNNSKNEKNNYIKKLNQNNSVDFFLFLWFFLIIITINIGFRITNVGMQYGERAFCWWWMTCAFFVWIWWLLINLILFIIWISLFLYWIIKKINNKK